MRESWEPRRTHGSITGDNIETPGRPPPASARHRITSEPPWEPGSRSLFPCKAGTRCQSRQQFCQICRLAGPGEFDRNIAVQRSISAGGSGLTAATKYDNSRYETLQQHSKPCSARPPGAAQLPPLSHSFPFQSLRLGTPFGGFLLPANPGGSRLLKATTE